MIGQEKVNAIVTSNAFDALANDGEGNNSMDVYNSKDEESLQATSSISNSTGKDVGKPSPNSKGKGTQNAPVEKSLNPSDAGIGEEITK